jgi:hypothetical protein
MKKAIMSMTLLIPASAYSMTTEIGNVVLADTAPLTTDGAISTMTIVIATMVVSADITFYATSTAVGGDICISFNGDRSPVYSLSRTTFTVTTLARPIIATASTTATCLPIFGVSNATTTARSVTLSIKANHAGVVKMGTFMGVAESGRNAAPLISFGGWNYAGTQVAISTISFFQINRANQPSAGGFRNGRVRAFGNKN